MPQKKSNGQLTDLQLCTLIALWTLPPGMVANTTLTRLRINLERPARDELVQAGLVKVHRERDNGPLSLQLTDAGRDRVDEHIDAALPSGTKCGVATLRLVLATVRPLLHQPPPVPDGAGSHPPAAADLDMEARIRTTYAAVAPRPGAWVMLSRLRDALGAADRAAVDAALIRLNRSPDVQVVPDSNQKVLTDAERAGAVRIGNQDRHAISIGP